MTLGLNTLTYNKEFPEIVYAVNKDGKFISKMDADKTKLKNTQYWQIQYRKIGVLMFLSAIILISILLFETKLIELIWSAGLNIIGGLL